MSTIDVNNLLAQMRLLSVQAQAPEHAIGAPAAKSTDFAALLKQSIAAVGQSQEQAGQMAAAFERGDPGADLGRTMVAIQKADLSLNALVQVNSKLVNAYNAVMNMTF